MRRVISTLLLATSCVTAPIPSDPAVDARELLRSPGSTPMDLKAQVTAAKAELLAKYGPSHKARIDRGVDQVAALWRDSDGDLSAFARQSFIADDTLREETLARLEEVFEQLDGHLNEINRELRRASDLDLGPILPVDRMLASMDPWAHITEDLFASKVAFTVLLNFPLTTLKERLTEGPRYDRRTWAEVRLASRFARRIPGEVQQEAASAAAEADLYVAQYNFWMHHLLTEKGERLFPKGLRLISHWNLRDELKADYADPRGLEKQRMIVKVMERIVTQAIPAAVIDNPRLDWNPFTQAVSVTPASELEENAPAGEVKADVAPEPSARYARWLAQYKAARRVDPFAPVTPTAIARSFELSREIPEERVMELLSAVLESPSVPRIAALIQKRLGRKLEPQDLWYNGFQARGRFSEAQLDEIVRKRYPDADAFAADIPRILERLGFASRKAELLSAHIAVDPARGAGHAMPAMRRGDFPRLRTRIPEGGMDYKGYNVAIHELGHNVEQVISLYEVDHTLLAGVPNNAFTEAFAFLFQARDLELLGLAKPDAESERLRVLHDFWATWEIAGVALVDIKAWHWMYEHPNAAPAELRDAVVQISKEIWNRYYAPVLGERDSVLLGIYSHLVAYPLYVSDYPLGHLISFQIEEQVRKGLSLGSELERMARVGSVTPDVWMQKATDAPVSAEPLLRATEKALEGL